MRYDIRLKFDAKCDRDNFLRKIIDTGFGNNFYTYSEEFHWVVDLDDVYNEISNLSELSKILDETIYSVNPTTNSKSEELKTTVDAVADEISRVTNRVSKNVDEIVPEKFLDDEEQIIDRASQILGRAQEKKNNPWASPYSLDKKAVINIIKHDGVEESFQKELDFFESNNTTSHHSV